MDKIVKLTNELKTLEEQLISHPSKLELRTILTVKADLQSLLHEETGFARFQIHKKIFKMLAYKLKQAKGMHSIPVIKDGTGTLDTDNIYINSAFNQYYCNLYESEFKPSDQDLNRFFNRFILPSLNAQGKAKLEAPLTQSEIQLAIKKASDKTPGEDGFSPITSSPNAFQ